MLQLMREEHMHEENGKVKQNRIQSNLDKKCSNVEKLPIELKKY